MELGSPEHKQEFLATLTKTYQENIWKEELGIMEFEELLGNFRKERAELDLKLERKEFSSAGEGRKQLAQKDSMIESTQAAIQKQQANKVFWTMRIDLIKRYSELN